MPTLEQTHAPFHGEAADDSGGIQSGPSRFGVERGRIVDVSGTCPGFATLPSFNKSVVHRNTTLSKAIWERDAEIKRRAAAIKA
jgi:hypothetical protein